MLLNDIESEECWAMSPEWSIQEINTVHQIKVLTGTLNNPKGALIITLHLSAWEMMNAWVHQYGIPTIMCKSMKDRRFNAFTIHTHQRIYTTLISNDVNTLFKTKQGDLRTIFT